MSVFFGLIALGFGVLGVRALTLGPDAPAVSHAAIVKRTVTANQMEARIRQAANNAPPVLPTVPSRASTPAPTAGTGSAPGQQLITLPAPGAAPSVTGAGGDHGTREGGRHADD